MELFEPSQHLLFTEQRRCGERPMQHRGTQGPGRILCDGRKTEMPGFGRDARHDAAIRAEESEPGRVRLQPLREQGERSTRRELLRRQLYPVLRRDRAHIDEIDIRPPVMAAGARKR